MSQISFLIPPNHGESQGRDEKLPSFVDRKPHRLDNEVHIQVIPPQGGFIWTTGNFIQPR